MAQERKPFTKDQICDYWDSKHERISAMLDICWCCGDICLKLEKAHIVALCEGGIDEPSNIHLLCANCHQKTEGLTEDQYWKYLGLVSWNLNGKIKERYELLVAVGAIKSVTADV